MGYILKLMISREERRKLIKKLRSPFSTTGVRIPPEIYLEGEKIPVEELIIKLGKKELSGDEIFLINEIKKRLESKITENLRRMENEELEEKEFRRLYDETLVLKRALLEFDALLSKTSLKDTSYKIEDYKRWLEYMKQILGK